MYYDYNKREIISYFEGSIIDLVKLYKPTSIVDVGAHIGVYTWNYVNAGHFVHAFEPFPPNIEFFKQKNNNNTDRYVLYEKAASNSGGTAEFFLPSIVSEEQSSEWSKPYIGSSATGSLANANKNYDRIEVDKCRVDDYVDDDVLLLKTDTQGHELSVLQGCERLMANSKIKYIEVEFTGEVEVLDLLHENDFLIFDQPAFLTFGKKELINNEDYDVKHLEDVPLSNGHVALLVKILNRPKEFGAYCKFMKENTSWNDLFAVHKSELFNFLQLWDHLI